MRKNVILGLVSLTAVALAIAVVWQQGELRKSREAAVEAQRQAQAAEAKADAAKTAVRSVQTEEAEVLQHLRTAEASAALAKTGSVRAVRTAAAPADTNNASPLAGIAKMMKNPGMKSMIRAQSEGQIEMMYGALFKGLSLSAEDKASFKNLLLDKQMALVDLSMGLMDGSATADQRKDMGSKIAEVNKNYDEQIKTLLGADNFPLYQEYETTQPERMEVNLFKQSLIGADALSEQQEHDLIRAMYDERKDYPEIAKQFDRSNPPDPTTFTESAITNLLAGMARLQEKNLTRASSILNASQLAEFKKSQEQMRAMQEMGMKVAAQMFGHGKSGGP